MPKMADFGVWRGEKWPRWRRGGRKTDRNGAGRAEKAVVDRPPSPEAMVDKQIHANGHSDASERRPYLSIMDFGCGRERSPSGPLFSGA